jgi:PAS domain S-box-containing protein
MPQRIRHLQALYQLTAALSRAGALAEVYQAALRGLQHALAIDRASILLIDPDGVMRFKAWQGLSARYRSVTEGHTPWSPDTSHPLPVLVPDVDAEPSLASLHDVIREEGVRALAFVPLVHHGRLLGKFMLYYPTPYDFPDDEIQLAQSISDHIAVAVVRRQAEEALYSSEQRLALAYQAARLGTFDWNIRTNAVVWTREEETLYGLPPGAFGGNYEHWKQAVHSDDREQAERAVVTAAQTGTDLDTEFRVVWPDGSVHWIAAKGRVMHDEAGQPERMIGINEDITERKRREQTQAFLAAASKLLASSLDYETTLQQVAYSAVPTMADWCFIGMACGHGDVRELAIGHDDPVVAARVRALLGQSPPDPTAAIGISAAIRTRQAQLVPVITELTPSIARDDAAWSELAQLIAASSYMCVPLLVRGQAIGAISFLMGTSKRCFTAADLAVAQELAHHAAHAIDNARLYREAQDAIRVRDQFLSIAAHELKTPLTSLLGYAQLFRRRAERERDLSERDERALRVIVEQGLRLNKMILALLDIARIETGQLSIERTSIDLVALVRRVVEETHALLDQQQLQLSCPSGPLMIMGDELRLEQVLQNLISNALKYSLNTGAVQIRVEQEHDTARIVVADQGLGIPTADIPRLFERFYRASNADVQHITGMGIGLYIVKEILLLHGGTITVESTEGEGSTFIVDLPRTSAGCQDG